MGVLQRAELLKLRLEIVRRPLVQMESNLERELLLGGGIPSTGRPLLLASFAGGHDELLNASLTNMNHLCNFLGLHLLLFFHSLGQVGHLLFVFLSQYFEWGVQGEVIYFESRRGWNILCRSRCGTCAC